MQRQTLYENENNLLIEEAKGGTFMQTNNQAVIKPLCEAEVSAIYHDHAVYDFPKAELKPLSTMLKLMKSGDYLCYGLFEGEGLRAYAFFVKNGVFLLLDYYAVCRGYRSSGYGSQFLSMLRNTCRGIHGIILEVEAPDCALNEEELTIRTRRIDFYERSGVRKTSLTSVLFDVDYDIMYLPCEGDYPDEQLREELLAIYRKMISQEAFENRLKVREPGAPRV